MCPQFDILWPEITVKEHLTLYAEIKGYNNKDARAVADAAARDVGQCPALDAPLDTGSRYVMRFTMGSALRGKRLCCLSFAGGTLFPIRACLCICHA